MAVLPMPNAKALLSDDYSRNYISHLCPVCVYNSILRLPAVANSEFSSSSVQKWIL